MTHSWVTSLLKWYSTSKREMPWREISNPYYTWISEMMLQQTQVATVIPYFNRFIQTFPNIKSLADSDLQVVLKCWEGLGYYSRARNLHKAAKIIVNEYDAKLPSDFVELQTLPGIGPYCAAAITSIAFYNPVPVVDGNVLRVFTRFWGIFDDIRQNKVKHILFEKLSAYIKDVNASDFNQAIMECGALICTPKNPNCECCPLSATCFAYVSQKQSELPVKSKSSPTPHYDIAVALIKYGDKVLIAKRNDNQMLGGLWEFPGGKVEANESIQDTVIREVREELSLDINVDQKITVIKHAYSHFKISMYAFWCSLLTPIGDVKTHETLKWVHPIDFKDYPFPKANIKLFDYLKSV